MPRSTAAPACSSVSNRMSESLIANSFSSLRLSEIPNCVRTWELRLSSRFSPALVLRAFLASLLASFCSRAALQVGSPVSSSRGSSLAYRCCWPHPPSLPVRRNRNGSKARPLGAGSPPRPPSRARPAGRSEAGRGLGDYAVTETRTRDARKPGSTLADKNRRIEINSQSTNKIGIYGNHSRPYCFRCHSSR